MGKSVFESALCKVHDDVLPWRETWKSYDAILEGLEKPELKELDDWYRKELPTLLKNRSPPYMKQEELSKLMKWKLTKGKWRPRLQCSVDALQPKAVEESTKIGFACLSEGNIRGAFNAVTVLRGVGPATASAVLSAFDNQIPFMGDEALNALASEIGPRKYTMSHFEKFINELKRLAAELNKLEQLTEVSGGVEWDPQIIQFCLWAESKSLPAVASETVSSSSSSKRKSTEGTKSGRKKRKP